MRDGPQHAQGGADLRAGPMTHSIAANQPKPRPATTRQDREQKPPPISTDRDDPASEEAPRPRPAQSSGDGLQTEHPLVHWNGRLHSDTLSQRLLRNPRSRGSLLALPTRALVRPGPPPEPESSCCPHGGRVMHVVDPNRPEDLVRLYRPRQPSHVGSEEVNLLVQGGQDLFVRGASRG